VTAESLTPPEVIAAILAAPVDLLWFGGIGTFVKAPGEPDSAVGDHANDTVRITSEQLRARVVAEGGNLGVTQEARVRYSRRGGRINTDFIDNAAGVATSDREVNCKILLALAIEEGRLDPGERDGYLARSEDEVANAVLRQVDHSVVALTRAAPDSVREFNAYVALLNTLEDAGRLDRAVEGLPSPDELRVRKEAGAGFIRPELAVLLAYAKSDLVAAIEASSLVGDPALSAAVIPYFPAPLRGTFEDLIPRHRLYPQLVATDVGGELVDQLGMVWAHETAAELGRDVADVAGAFWAAREVIGAGDQWADLEQRSAGLSADAEAALHATISDAVISLARAYLTSDEAVPLGQLIARDIPLADQMAATGAGEATKTDEDALVTLGVPRDVAHQFVLAAARAGIGAAGQVARRTGRPVAAAAEAIELVGRAGAVDGLQEAVGRALAVVPAPSRLTVWQARALLDDISAWQQTAAAAALAQPLSVAAAVAAWEASHERELARAALLTRAAPPDTSDPLAVTALTLRRLQLAL
jgi:glutamate dehydrogenase